MMRTVKEVSSLTGISVRTLHYYDEIGLLKPSQLTDTGYRLYDDKALEVLQQILFFREFDIPLKDIKSIITSPTFDKTQVLQGQRKMLMLKKKRLEGLIHSIDDILKGENKMDFEVFSKSEIEELYQAMITNLPKKVKESLIKDWGSLDGFHDHYIKVASTEKHQKIYAKMVEWYGGDKDKAKAAATNPPNSEIIHAYEKRSDIIMKKLAAKMGMDVSSFEVKEIIGEYGFVFKQLYQLDDEKQFMLDMANVYEKDGLIRDKWEQQYGEGISDFFVSAVREFYSK